MQKALILGFLLPLAAARGEVESVLRETGLASNAIFSEEVLYTGSSSYHDWPPSDVGDAIVPQQPDGELREALAEVDPDRIKATILKLVSFGTRHTLSTQSNSTRGIGAARDWIAAELHRYAAQPEAEGRLDVKVQSFIQGVASRIPFPVRISNVVATLKGSLDPQRVYVVSGHYDSRVTDELNYESDAPGANDDASGVAVMLELARILSTRKPAATLVFAAVAGEEQGLYGSAFLAQTYRNASVRVEGMLNNDIVGSSTGSRGERDATTVRVFCQGTPLTESSSQMSARFARGGENDSPARQLGRFIQEVATNNYTGMNVAMIYRLDRYLRGGDHKSFLDQGYAAVRFSEPNENFDHQHQDVKIANGRQYGDLPEFVDYDYVAGVARVNLAALWTLANSPGNVKNVTLNSTLLSNDSELHWLPVNSSNLKGYEVVWRPTDASMWSRSVFVGNVSTITIPVSKDNVIFGVRAVGVGDHKGPATVAI